MDIGDNCMLLAVFSRESAPLSSHNPLLLINKRSLMIFTKLQLRSMTCTLHRYHVKRRQLQLANQNRMHLPMVHSLLDHLECNNDVIFCSSSSLTFHR